MTATLSRKVLTLAMVTLGTIPTAAYAGNITRGMAITPSLPAPVSNQCFPSYNYGFGYAGFSNYYYTPYYLPPPYPIIDPSLAVPGATAPAGTNGPQAKKADPPAVALPPPVLIAIPEPRPNFAEFTILVPEDAEIWIEGVKMKQTGSNRRFVSPPLVPGKNYAYEIRVTWTDNGRKVSTSQQIGLRAGDRSMIAFLTKDKPAKQAEPEKSAQAR